MAFVFAFASIGVASATIVAVKKYYYPGTKEINDENHVVVVNTDDELKCHNHNNIIVNTDDDLECHKYDQLLENIIEKFRKIQEKLILAKNY
jgi:deoxyinosine 3'endonuclease (endonuclease V)